MHKAGHSHGEVYILFYTSLLDSYDQRDGEGFTPRFWDMVFQNDDHVLNRICNYLSPPFCACKIAFKRKDGFESYGVSKNGFEMQHRDFLDKAGFCFLKLNVKWYQMNIIESIIKKFLENKNNIYFSYLKMGLVHGKLRQWTCMGPGKRPNVEQRDWTCSEFVTYTLQEAGVLDSSSIHPTYTSPSNLFYELLDSRCLDIPGSVNYFCNNNYTDPNIVFQNTNAYYLYCKIMDIRDVEEIHKVKKEFMDNSLCKKFRIKSSDVNQFSIVSIVNGEEFDLYNYLDNGNKKDEGVEKEKERSNVINSLPAAPKSTSSPLEILTPIVPSSSSARKGRRPMGSYHDTPLYV